jgi:3-hydroxy-9,10-secoandrosta-1,3,5(10)-triene-9,17-dione monooxygenase reductase component
MTAVDVRPAAAVAADFRAVAGRLPTGVTVVAVRAGDLTHAMTVNSFTTVSLDPPLVLFCARRTSRTAALLPAAGAFAVTASPVLACGLAYFDCTLETVHVAGDHDVVVGRVAAFGAMGAGEPLVFAGGAYLSISAPGGSSYR